MLSIQHSLLLRWSLVVVWHFVMLMTQTSCLKLEEEHPSQSTVPDDARLAGGGSLCSGRLEMKHEGEWRPLTTRRSNTYFEVRYATVACRQMGCGSAVSIARTTYSTDQKIQKAWEVHFTCRGTESYLKECSSTMSERKVQGKRSAAYSLEVNCSESVRLVGASHVCAGSVEVKSDQGWVPVCQDGFDSEVKKVVCRQLGCGTPENFIVGINEREEPVLFKQFQCKGNESRLEDCASSIHNDCRQASKISCSNYDVRLVGGDNHCKGRLEGKHNGEWKPLIHVRRVSDTKHLAEFCRLMGCADIISFSRGYLPEPQLSWELSISCDDRSPFCKDWTGTDSTRVINVTCSEAVRLAKGPSRCEGELEVKSGQSWVSVCHSFFSSEAALVTCRDLECGFPAGYYGKSRGKFQNTDPVFNCEGKEEHLMDCPSTMLNATEETLSECYNTYLTCTDRPHAPSVSVHVQGQELDRAVVFKGHRFAIYCITHSPYKILSFRLQSSFYSKQPTEQIQPAVDGEAVFMFPPAEDAHYVTYECNYNFDFSPEVFSEPDTVFLIVKEHNDVRLVSGDTRCAGRLELEHQKEWRPVSYQHSWSLKEAAVLCRQLNCGSAVSTSKVDNAAGLLPAWRFYSDCDGSERALMDCGTVTMWHSSSPVEVVCTDVLLRPNISVTLMNGLFNNRQQNLLFKGRSFIINCSVEPQFPGGHFTVIFTGINHTHSETQPAVNHSALFTYTGANEALQGNYSCVYHNFVFNHNFSSESLSLPLIVLDEEDVTLDFGVLRDDDSHPCAGTLFVNHEGGWKMLSADSTVWDLKHASLVCRQLGCGSAVSTKEINLPKKEAVVRFFSDCDGSESALFDCGTGKLWFSSTVVEVTCTGNQGAAGEN